MSLDSLRLHNPNIPDPNMTSEIALKGNIGYFPELDFYMKHGFWWKNPENIAYHREPGYPADEAVSLVQKRIERFFKALDLSPLHQGIVGVATPGDMRIVDIDEKILGEIPATKERGRFIEGGAFFTMMPGIPVYSIVGDCTWSFFYAQKEKGASVGGIAHSGRVESESLYPRRLIGHLKDKYNFAAENIRIGIIPSLEPEYHIIQPQDIDRVINNKEAWENYMIQPSPGGVYHLDVRSWVADQFIEEGVLPQNIKLSLRGTYQSAMEGTGGFSHRYATVSKTHSQRFGIAFQLK